MPNIWRIINMCQNYFWTQPTETVIIFVIVTKIWLFPNCFLDNFWLLYEWTNMYYAAKYTCSTIINTGENTAMFKYPPTSSQRTYISIYM